MNPGQQFDIEAIKKQRVNLAAMIDTLKQQRAAIHQIGDADCKLIELDRDAAPAGDTRRRDLLEQKRDGTHRLAAGKIQVLTLQISQTTTEMAMVDQVIDAAGKMILTH